MGWSYEIMGKQPGCNFNIEPDPGGPIGRSVHVQDATCGDQSENNELYTT